MIIANIDDYRPQLLINLPDGEYVIPVLLVERIADGSHKADTKTAQVLASAIIGMIDAD